MEEDPVTKSTDHELPSPELTETIIACAYKVSNTLGCGFLEKVYENALAYELRNSGLRVDQQHPTPILYAGILVGDYYADLLVENQVIIELKTVEAFNDIHIAQCLNYLKATGLHLCLLLNFHYPKVQIKRIVYNLPENKDNISGSHSKK